MEDIRLWVAPAVSLAIAIGSIFVMRSQLSDVRGDVKDLDQIVRGERGVLTRLGGLEKDHSSHAETLNGTIRRLEQVTKDLQQLTLDLARANK